MMVQDGDTDSGSTGTTKKQTGKASQAGLGSGVPGAKTGPHHVPSSGKSVVVASVVQSSGAVIEQSLNPARPAITKPKLKGNVKLAKVSPSAGGGSQTHGRGKQTLVKGTTTGPQRQTKKKEVVQKEELLGAVKGEVPELILPRLHDSDWESSEEEMPFLGGSLPPGDRTLSHCSASSSESEDTADANPSSVNITPKFLANINVSVGKTVGEELEAGGSDSGDRLEMEKAPSAWLAISSSDSEQ